MVAELTATGALNRRTEQAGLPAAHPVISYGEEPLSYRFTLVVLTGGVEAQAAVEGFRAVLAGVIGNCQPLVPAPHSFMAWLFYGESSVALALVPGVDVEPPQVAVEQRVLILGGERGHDEAHQLVTVVDQPGPGDIGHRVGVGKRPGDWSNEIVLISPQPQHAGSSHIFLGYLFQSQARPHGPTLRPSGAVAVFKTCA